MTKKQSDNIKGMALLLMFWHHLFGCGDFLVLPENKWYPIISERIAIYLGQSGKVCIAMFLFCSGYGLYKSYIQNERLKSNNIYYIYHRFIKTLIPYWVIMLFTIFYLIYAGTLKISIKYLVVNLFALLHNDYVLYVSFSWFIKLYLGIILILPLIKVIERKKKNFFIDLLIYIVFPLLLYVVLKRFENEGSYINIGLFILSSISMILSWLSLFFVGMLFAKYNIYEFISSFKILKKTNRVLVIILSFFIIISALIIRVKIKVGCITDIFYGPIIIICILLILDNIKIHSKYILRYLGKHSLQYWLLSGLFFLNTSELQFILFIPKYTILILIWKILIITPLVFVCDFFSSKVVKIVCKE